MPRAKRIIHRYGKSGVVEELVTETYTLRQDLPDGGVIRHDGEHLFYHNGCAWYGVPPEGWDASKAVADDFTRSYECEADYS